MAAPLDSATASRAPLIEDSSRAPQKRHKQQKQAAELFLSILAFLRCAAGVPNEERSAHRDSVWSGHGRFFDSSPPVTLSNENGSSRS